MKKTFLVPLMIVAAAVFSLASCMKTKDATPQCTNSLSLTQDKQIIDSFLNAKELTGYTYDDQSGAYYYVQDAGTGATKPTGDSLVAFHYETRLMNGTLVDSATATPASYSLTDYANNSSYSGRALGVGFALPKISKGGTVNIIVPSSAAFGCNTVTLVSAIPANSQLIYTYQLLDIKRSNY